MWRRRARPTLGRAEHFDVRDREALRAALAVGLPATRALTVYMCWHAGLGHDFPADVMQAAGRLRERHTMNSGSDDQYTSVKFMPSNDDVADFVRVAPFCDLAYATDAEGNVVLEVSEQGGSLLGPQDVGRDGE